MQDGEILKILGVYNNDGISKIQNLLINAEKKEKH